MDETPPLPKTEKEKEAHPSIGRVEGDVIKIQDSPGAIVKPGLVTIIEEQAAYDVRGLPNPYPGLRSFTYADREAYAGRETSLRQAMAKLVDPGDRPALLFITGASGSGKSSFAQARLLPALVGYYEERHKTVRPPATFRPLARPLANLADALVRLGFPEVDAVPGSSERGLSSFTAQDLAQFLADHTPPGTVNLMVFDQFEELYTQSAPEQRSKTIEFLAGWPAFSQARTHLILTLRSDFLDRLIEEPALWAVAKEAVVLRQMPANELEAAILAPLEARCKSDRRYCEKRFEPDLLEALTRDAVEKDTYLTLLQLTLEDLWKRGSLTLGNYKGLSRAIQERADTVYAFQDYDENPPSQPRPPEDRQELLGIFLDLVEVSLDNNPLRTVRRRREKTALEGTSGIRPRLVEDMVVARLLSAETEMHGAETAEMIDLIHESLISGWDLLEKAIEEQRDQLRRRVRFEQALADWMDPKNTKKELLRGVRLEEARELRQSGDIALSREEAQEFLRLSEEEIEAEQRRELERERDRIRAVAVSDHLRKELRGLVGGAAGFALAFLATYWQQAVDRSLLLFVTLVHTLPGAIAGLLFVLFVDAARARYQNRPDWRGGLSAGLGGALAFTLALLFKALLSSILDPFRLLLIAVEGGIWGLAAGAGSYWTAGSARPRWQTLSLELLASGLALVFADRLGNAFLRPGLGPGEGVHPFWIFLAGILLPLLVSIGTASGKSLLSMGRM